MEMRTQLTGQEATGIDNSTIRYFVKNQIMAERVKGAATMPSNPQFVPIDPKAMAFRTRLRPPRRCCRLRPKSPTDQPVAVAPTTPPVAFAPTTQPTTSVPTTQPIVTGVDTTPIIEEPGDIDDFDPAMPDDDGSNDD